MISTVSVMDSNELRVLLVPENNYFNGVLLLVCVDPIKISTYKNGPCIGKDYRLFRAIMQTSDR